MDKKALRNERVQFTSKGAPGSTAILGAGQIPGSTNLVVVNQQTRGQVSMNQIGEVWIEKTNRAVSYESVVGASAQFIEHNESLFRQVKTSGFNNQIFIDTGLVGFLKAPDDKTENPALFIIGKKPGFEVLSNNLDWIKYDLSNPKRMKRSKSAEWLFSLKKSSQQLNAVTGF